MPKYLAVDFSRYRIRLLQAEGSLKNPKLTRFIAIDSPVAEEGEDADKLISKAIGEALSAKRMTREPSACALDSHDCTFRELELPFSSDDQISKVIKFEAESHLQLVDIDSVIVTFQKLRADEKGSRLLAMAYDKGAVLRRLSHLSQNDADPQFADLHLTALYTAMRESGRLAPEVPEDSEAPVVDSVVLVLECDRDVTNLLVLRGEKLVGARSIRVGTQVFHPSETRPDADEGKDPSGGHSPGKDLTDESLILVDDLGEGAVHVNTFFRRLKREIQRTLFPLGVAEEVTKVLALGAEFRDKGFLQEMEDALELPVEVVRPFDGLEHSLSESELEEANAEGAAALGIMLRQMGSGHSTCDFRQEEARFARRFDQVKVSLTWMVMMCFVIVVLYTLEQFKARQMKIHRMRDAAAVALNTYSLQTADRSLEQSFRAGRVKPFDVISRVRTDLQSKREELATALGRSETIPVLPSGLDYLNSIINSLDQALPKIGRLELNMLDFTLVADRPSLKLKGKVQSPTAAEMLTQALQGCPVVASVDQGSIDLAPDGRYELSGTTVWLKKNVNLRAGLQAPKNTEGDGQ